MVTAERSREDLAVAAVRSVIPDAVVGWFNLTAAQVGEAPDGARPALEPLVGSGVLVFAVPITDEGLWVWHHHGDVRSLLANYVLDRATAAVEQAFRPSKVISVSKVTGQCASMAELGELAGLGSRGWNNLLLHPEHGSWLQIEALAVQGAPFVAAPPSATDVCIRCGLCVEACPVDAVEPGDFHAPRCARVVASPWKVTSKAVALTENTYLECRECISSCPIGRSPEQLFAWRQP
jgi:ferredoxin